MSPVRLLLGAFCHPLSLSSLELSSSGANLNRTAQHSSGSNRATAKCYQISFQSCAKKTNCFFHCLGKQQGVLFHPFPQGCSRRQSVCILTNSPALHPHNWPSALRGILSFGEGHARTEPHLSCHVWRGCASSTMYLSQTQGKGIEGTTKLSRMEKIM